MYRRLKPLTTAAVLIVIPWTAARAQSPQSAYQSPFVQYQVVAAPVANPFAKCFTTAAPTPAPVQTAWVGVASPAKQYQWGPTPIGSSIAWLGEKMTHAGRRHTWTVQHTRFVPFRQPVQQSQVYYMAVPAAAPAAVPSAQHSFEPAAAPQTASIGEEAPAPPAVPTPTPGAPIRLPNPYPLRLGSAPDE
jgi:hypothetical protein